MLLLYCVQKKKALHVIRNGNGGGKKHTDTRTSRESELRIMAIDFVILILDEYISCSIIRIYWYSLVEWRYVLVLFFFAMLRYVILSYFVPSSSSLYLPIQSIFTEIQQLALLMTAYIYSTRLHFLLIIPTSSIFLYHIRKTELKKLSWHFWTR